MNCECGRPLITLPNGETICAATAERFKAMHGYEYGSTPKRNEAKQ